MTDSFYWGLCAVWMVGIITGALPQGPWWRNLLASAVSYVVMRCVFYLITGMH